MALIDLWNSDRTQAAEKRVDQIIAFAGDGKLRDGNATSVDFRQLLSIVPSDVIGRWIDECLENRFDDFGFVLQDIINEIGHRLNFQVTHGVYRGRSGEGYDGLWQLADECAIIIESKSSTAFSINLTRIAGYRKQVASTVGLHPDDISILLVVGEDDTEEVEAQVRGSRFAWSVRLLGMRSLVRLLVLKESLDDPAIERQIRQILVPQEFTRLDRIVDLIFATAEDAQSDDEIVPNMDNSSVSKEKRRTGWTTPANFHLEIIPKLENRFSCLLVKQSRVTWASPDKSVLVSCQVSKTFDKSNVHYWFGLKRTTKEKLEAHPHAFCAFGLGSPDRVVLLPYERIQEHLERFYTSPDPDGLILHWHIRFLKTDDKIKLLTSSDHGPIDVTDDLLPR